jgi:bacterioferritin-associated ferredoxin
LSQDGQSHLRMLRPRCQSFVRDSGNTGPRRVEITAQEPDKGIDGRCVRPLKELLHDELRDRTFLALKERGRRFVCICHAKDDAKYTPQD